MSDQLNEGEPKETRNGINRRSFITFTAKTLAYAAAAATALVNPFESNRGNNNTQQKAGAQIPGVEVIDHITSENQTDQLFEGIKAFVFEKYIQNDLSQINQKIEAAAKEHLDKTEFFPPFAAKIKNYHALIINAAKTIEKITGKTVDPDWIGIMFGLILAESSGDPGAVHVDPEDPNNEEKEDRGLCQIKLPTERIVRNKLNWGEVNIFDPGINITIGLEYLMILMEKYNDPVLALSAYNFGDEVVDAHRDKGGHPLSNPGIENVIKVLGSAKAVLLG
ncbi:hypothetical protein A3F00_01875 [Candidatus Daviesbacteria bacterium RIFCSPHIGHO2_12_FULL_37_11]|uniref:Transglycosylase SLT domain-containing protein n=1 Tax=Candidatus Daviesbacteria bacterium RIFCSPHIGHO2_12_FULL_37_11 TaxID=1797777 RepID=A0A1F5KDC2_9BACT|nr:MAG: hypothetical protein A2111_00890 [Candidatus Daviesbacteria bacterium GWA1_38_6]OGE17692.1 MAG: hypothetical protein A2769_01425 [Candidatus Daviesbacteria bacterium RIFCSPHIGHO2_01_FULL_37_27]OGE38937.1 MAG: hypothetical protein A3F00_01875 [Candidatus Daviesbacteria bacterium RIFCSPHIGHO2_12_FULL_37_11]OGE46150.1 MAG: hypothetical protein A3B39_02015 [Candidatus Daviesbacteria bacterium RIFCSPLOWO2_01_FULL_37_10]